MVLIKGSGRDEIRRTSHLIKKIEIGQVDIVWTHATTDDLNWCSCDVVILDALVPPGGTPNPDDVPTRKRVPVRQQSIGNRNGNPWTPKVGEMVLLSFDQNDKPFIEGTIYQRGMPPVCRSSAHPKGMILPNGKCSGPYEDRASGYYDIRHKRTQYLTTDRIDPPGYYGVFPYDDRLRPVCSTYFDKTRDCMFVFECKKGRDVMDCKECTLNGDGSGQGPDYIKCEPGCDGAHPAANIFLKFLGNDYEGTDDLKLRTKYHHSCGSLFCWDGKDAAEGRIWLESMVGHVHRSHINFKPDALGADLSLRSYYTNGAQARLYGYTSADFGRILLKNWETGNYIDIEKRDEITIHAAKIILDGSVEITGNNKIDGSCDHNACTCTGTSGGGTGTGSQVAVAHGCVDQNSNPVVPSECQAFCTGGGGSCSAWCDDTYIYITCTNGVTYKWKVKR